MIKQMVEGYEAIMTHMSYVFDTEKKLEIFLFLSYFNNRKSLNANEDFKAIISQNPE